MKESVNISVVEGERLWVGGGNKGRDYLSTCYNSTTHAASANGPATGCFGSQNKARVPHPSNADPLSELANKDYNTQLPVAN